VSKTPPHRDATAQPGQGRTAAIAARLAEVTYDSLDAEVVECVKRLIVDGIAVAVAGSREPAPAIVAAHVRELGAKPEATVWGHGYRTTAQHAAYCNAAAMHVLDFEPMSSPPTHAVSPTVPAALALAEALGASGRDVIAACAKGFELQGRVLLASSHDRGGLAFHTPGVVGVMGSTAAATHLLRLAPSQIVHALGAAASRCSGLPANTGSMVKCTHCGNVAAAGVEAALLARGGFSAHPDIFEAERGYVETFFPRHFDYDALLEFGRPWRCVSPGMALKFYPSKYPTHFAIAAALDVRSRVGDAARIREVRIVTPDMDDADRARPRSGLEGKFSFQYTAAAALLDGGVGIATFSDARRFRPDMEALLGKTTVSRDAARSRDTRNMQVDVEVVTNDGAVHRATCNAPPGTWGQPVNPARHHEKLRDCLSVRLDEVMQRRVLESLAKLEQLSPAALSELIGFLA
jgi:aconitate decarboxylase